MYKEITFTFTELHEAIKYIDAINSISTNSSTTVTSNKPALAKRRFLVLTPGSQESRLYNENNRVERSLLFLQQAISTSFLPGKISFYVLVLECLFSTSESKEITFSIGLLIARYMGGSSEVMRQTYAQVKNAYDVRSKYLHGQELGKSTRTYESLKQTSQEIDEFIRKVLRKVLLEDATIFKDNKTDFKKYFDKLIFAEAIVRENPGDEKNSP